MGVGALINGGMLIPPTFLKRTEAEARRARQARDQARDERKDALPDAAQRRKGHRRQRPTCKGYYVGGKTGTAEKVVNGRYSKTKVLTDFMAVLPADQPRYVLLIMIDEPQALPETHGFATSGWNAVPVGGAVIARIAPLLGIEPRMDLPTVRPADTGLDEGKQVRRLSMRDFVNRIALILSGRMNFSENRSNDLSQASGHALMRSGEPP